MSNTDLYEVPLTNWFDSESDFPEISSVNSIQNPGVNVISPFANIHHEQALVIEDINATGSASNRGNPLNPVGHVLLEETGSDKGVNLLEIPTHTPPQSKSPPFSCHRGWAMGRGRGMRR